MRWRLVTWNMNASQRSADQRRQAWELLDDLKLDAACLQETFAPPTGRRATYAPADDEAAWALSDHCPVVVEFDVS